MTRTISILLLLFAQIVFAQDDSSVLKPILKHFYKTEKPVVKGRTQFLFLYCEKANNNEQLFETVNELKVSDAVKAKIRSEITADMQSESWSADLEKIYVSDKSLLKSKINDCFSLEQYQVEYQKRNVNNQRLMIVSKPIFYSATHAIVKVVFYRNIEHNNGSVLHLEKVNNEWVIREHLNPWST